MYYKILKLSAGILLSVCALNANAGGGYWGGALGSSSYDVVDGELDDGTALRIFAGTKTDGLGFEVEFSFADYAIPTTGIDVTATNLIFSGIGYVPVANGADLYGKLGVNKWSTELTDGTQTADLEDGIGLAMGVGVNIVASERLNFRIEYQILSRIEIEDGFDGDITQLTFGVALSY